MQPNVGVVDPAGLEQYGGEDNRAAIGAGPYSIESYTSGQGFVLKANRYHSDRAPSIETCEIVLIPDVNTALLALMNNEIQCLNTVSIEVYNTLKDDNWQILSVLDRVNPYWFNAREVEIFRDDVVREALCHMIDWRAARIWFTTVCILCPRATGKAPVWFRIPTSTNMIRSSA